MEREQFQSYLQNTALLNADSLEGVKKLTSDFPWFTIGWLLYLKNLKNLNHSDYETVLKKVAVMVPDRKMLFRFLNDELNKKVPIITGNNKTTAYNLEGDVELEAEKSLIDKFLSSDGSRLRSGKVSLGVNGNNGDKAVAEQSVKEDERLVTETLASIYLQQKNYDKALDAYQKLSLKYPEKSVYFAGRIKEIELLKTNI